MSASQKEIERVRRMFLFAGFTGTNTYRLAFKRLRMQELYWIKHYD